jgi:hypothetical protein
MPDGGGDRIRRPPLSHFSSTGKPTGGAARPRLPAACAKTHKRTEATEEDRSHRGSWQDCWNGPKIAQKMLC